MRSSLKKAAFWGGLAAFFGCGEEVPLGQRPLAEVDGQQITLAQLRRFEEALEG